MYRLVARIVVPEKSSPARCGVCRTVAAMHKRGMIGLGCEPGKAGGLPEDAQRTGCDICSDEGRCNDAGAEDIAGGGGVGARIDEVMRERAVAASPTALVDTARSDCVCAESEHVGLCKAGERVNPDGPGFSVAGAAMQADIPGGVDGGGGVVLEQ